jgi:hypothetical protein
LALLLVVGLDLVIDLNLLLAVGVLVRVEDDESFGAIGDLSVSELFINLGLITGFSTIGKGEEFGGEELTSS